MPQPFAILVTFAVPVTFPMFAHATSFNAVIDYNLSNPNSVWSYGNSTSGASFSAFNFSATNFNGTPGYNYQSTSANNYDLVGHNTSGVSQTTYDPTADELWMHPGNEADQNATVLFTAPDSAEYNFDGLFERVDTLNGAGDGVGVTIYKNGVAIVARTVLGTTYLDSSAFNDTVFLDAGDTLSFVVDFNGTYFNDSTGLKLNITEIPTSPVPEPSSIMLLGTGVLSAVGFARRKFLSA